MQLLLVGSLHKQMQEASKIAHMRGAKVSQVDTAEQAMLAVRKRVAN